MFVVIQTSSDVWLTTNILFCYFEWTGFWSCVVFWTHRHSRFPHPWGAGWAGPALVPDVTLGTDRNPNQISPEQDSQSWRMWTQTVRIQRDQSTKWTGVERNTKYLRSCQSDACLTLNPRRSTGPTLALPSNRQTHSENGLKDAFKEWM